MTGLDTAVPIGLGIVAAMLFYVSFRYRDARIIGRFELFYGLGNLVVLALLYSIYLSLQNQGNTFQGVAFALFDAMLWIYVLICTVIVLRMVANIFQAVWKKRLGDYIGW